MLVFLRVYLGGGGVFGGGATGARGRGVAARPRWESGRRGFDFTTRFERFDARNTERCERWSSMQGVRPPVPPSPPPALQTLWLTDFGGDREHNSPSSWLKRRHVHVCPASVPALRGVLRAGRRCNIGEFGNATRPAPAEPEADSPAPPTPAVPPGPPTFRDASRHRGQLDAKLRTRILYNDTKKTNRATGAARSRSRSRGPRARRRRRRRRSGRGTAVARRRPARA